MSTQRCRSSAICGAVVREAQDDEGDVVGLLGDTASP